jgi:hypothetical protein
VTRCHLPIELVGGITTPRATMTTTNATATMDTGVPRAKVRRRSTRATRTRTRAHGQPPLTKV